MLMELPSYNARVACIMGHLRRHACNYDKSEARGDLKNRRMGDMKVWKSDYVDMVTYDYCVPAHLGYSLSLMHCLEIVDEMVLSIFGQHILTFAPNPWSDMEWKPAEKVWKPDVTEIEMTPQLERLYHPKLNARDFDKEPLQMGQAEPGFTSTALRFPRGGLQFLWVLFVCLFVCCLLFVCFCCLLSFCIFGIFCIFSIF